MIYRFDPYSLDTDSLELTRGGDVIAIEPQVFSILAYLIENRDRVISKDELIDAVWDGRAISDGALNSRINAARRAVGDSGAAQAVIRTFPRRGFRFVGPAVDGGAADMEPAPASPLTDTPSIAVLPFENLSGDPGQDFFAEGMTEDLITALSRIRRFRVVARSSSFSYKGRSPDIRAVARDFDVRYVIEGSVRKAGNRIRLTVQLVEGLSGKHIWAERYDRELDDIFELQDELTLAIVGALEPAMSQAERDRVKRKPPDSLDAWESYQQGMSHLHLRTEDNVAAARKLFLRAMSIDPEFALAHAGYARTYYWNILLGTAESDPEEAQKSARLAVELDPDEAEVHLALGSVHYANLDLERAKAEYETALELNPSYAAAHHHFATVLIHGGRVEEGLPHLFTAIQLSPKDAEIALFHARLALAHLYLRRHEEAVEWARKAIRMPRIQWPAYCFLIAALAHLDRMDEAHEALDELLAFRPGITATYIGEHYPALVADNFNHLLDGLRKAGLPD